MRTALIPLLALPFSVFALVWAELVKNRRLIVVLKPLSTVLVAGIPLISVSTVV